MTETLTAVTTREITMGVRGADTVVRNIRAFPAGTEVYVTRIRDGKATVRVPGTLYRQQVAMTAIDPNA